MAEVCGVLHYGVRINSISVLARATSVIVNGREVVESLYRLMCRAAKHEDGR